MSNLFETGVGVAAAIAVAAGLPVLGPDDPPDHGLATAGLLEHDLLTQSLILEDGRISAPGGDGSGRLGIRLDPRAVERFRVESVRPSR